VAERCCARRSSPPQRTGDDFGTGYSSLSYLKKFKVDSIKIDKSFVKRLGQDPEATAIAQAVIALGHAMALSVTAEGVETEEQGCLLQVAGCNELQGFLFSQALIESELHAQLNQVFTPLIAARSGRSVSAQTRQSAVLRAMLH
jgi:EAL domain-containing protein (putative c-di-GMP-specific phosphodiesterase class I)